MKTAVMVVSLFAAAGCATELKYKFLRTDQSFRPSPHEALPRILADLAETRAVPPLRSVGVLQVTGGQRKTVGEFLGKISETGARLGCDALIQADVFEVEKYIESPNPVRNPGGNYWLPGDEASWQFLCAVNGATAFEAVRSYEYARGEASALRDAEMHMRVCDRSPPTGSHVPNYFVCSEMRGVLGRAIGMATGPGWAGGAR